MRSSDYSRVINWTSVFGLLLSLTVAGGFLLFSKFVSYDDEGYVLLSLRNFSIYGGLYDRVYTQYGPAFFLISEAIRSTFRMQWTNETARALTLLYWMGTAICCGLIVLNRTRSKLLGAMVLSLTFTYLVHNILEPGHPGSMLALLVSSAALIGSKWDIAERPGAAAAIGAIGAAVALIKLNVGALLLIAAVFWVLLRRSTEKNGYVEIILYLSLAAVPWVLMGPPLEHLRFVLQFAVALNLTMIGLFAAVAVTPRNPVRSDALIALTIGVLVISITVLVLIVARGTTFSGLISGVIRDPMKFPTINFRPVWWGPLSTATLFGALALAIGYYLRPCSEFFRHGIILGRFLGMAVLVATVVKPSSMAFLGLSYGLGLVALCAIPLNWDCQGVRDARFRQWLATLVVLQSLQAYPIAGSQVSWGTFLLVPLVVIAFKEAWESTPGLIASTPPLAIIRPLAVFLIAIVASRILIGGLAQFNKGERLGLPGAELLSLPTMSVLALRTLSENARAHGDQLFSVPGAFSFNLWTGLPTPTLANASLWDRLLNSGAQSEIMARLQGDPKAVIIRRVDANFNGTYTRSVFKGELGTYIEHDFETAFSINGYEFLVHHGRTVAPLSTANIRADPADPNHSLLDITLGELDAPITSIEIWQTGPFAWVEDISPPDLEEQRGRSLLTRLDHGTGSLLLTPLNKDGTPSGETRSSTWPVRIPNAVTLLEGRFDAGIIQTGDLFVLVRSADRVIAAVPVRFCCAGLK